LGYPQGPETRRLSGGKSGPRSGLAPSRSARKTARNLGFSALAAGTQNGWMRSDWSGRRDSNREPQPRAQSRLFPRSVGLYQIAQVIRSGEKASERADFYRPSGYAVIRSGARTAGNLRLRARRGRWKTGSTVELADERFEPWVRNGAFGLLQPDLDRESFSFGAVGAGSHSTSIRHQHAVLPVLLRSRRRSTLLSALKRPLTVHS
jgi:hypothetical protein